MKRVLIADDSRFMRQYLTTILKKNGYLVVAEAADGEAAVELYQKHSPDMVILDITMPKKSGIESLREIKMLNKDAKVVICSSMGQKFFIQDAYDNGAVDFIVKPFTIETIVGTVKKVLA
ncbi:MAG: response regulator [bacterium]